MNRLRPASKRAQAAQNLERTRSILTARLTKPMSENQRCEVPQAPRLEQHETNWSTISAGLFDRSQAGTEASRTTAGADNQGVKSLPSLTFERSAPECANTLNNQENRRTLDDILHEVPVSKNLNNQQKPRTLDDILHEVPVSKVLNNQRKPQ